MIDPSPRPEPQPLSEISTSADATLKRIYHVIGNLSLAGRDDLAIDLRKQLPELWSTGTPEMPNPFLLRKLAKDAENTWQKHEVDKLAATLSHSPSESYVIQKELAIKRSEFSFDYRQGINVFIDTKSNRLNFWVSTSDSIDELARVDKLLKIEGDETLHQRSRAHILGPQRLPIGSSDLLVEGRIFGCSCSIRRSFLFHTTVDVETEILLTHRAHIKEVSARLKKIDSYLHSRDIKQFSQLLREEGLDEALHQAEIPSTPGEDKILHYMDKYSVSRSFFKTRFREVREIYRRLCLESGMTLDKLRTEGNYFWDRLSTTMEK
jgi:hypothetical protein